MRAVRWWDARPHRTGIPFSVVPLPWEQWFGACYMGWHVYVVQVRSLPVYSSLSFRLSPVLSARLSAAMRVPVVGLR